MVKEITNNDLSEAKAAAIALVDFNADWCGPCQMLKPVFEKLSGEMADRLSFYSVNVDNNPALAEEFSVMSIPTIVILKNGEKAAQQVGLLPEQAFRDWIGRQL